MTTEPTGLERYRPIIDDWTEFCRVAARPHPTCIWVNGMRTDPARVQTMLRRDGIAVKALGWNNGAFRLPEGTYPARYWPYQAGLYHIQEEVSMLPVALLDPQPGERVLDLCAAPGNKTVQMAVAMGNTGTLVANDRNMGRMRAVRHHLERLGVVNVSTTVFDAAGYPISAGPFDRVLADVPCSCEGTSRKNPNVLEKITNGLLRRQTGLQTAILRRAVQLCRPGGRIVYATCTYAPEENEMIVDAVLKEYGPGCLKLLPTHVPGLLSSPGLTSWQGRTFDPSLQHAMRIWPHQNDTGGFFVALLEKSPEAEGHVRWRNGQSGERPDFMRPFDFEPWHEMMTGRFGIPSEDLDAYDFFFSGRKRIYMINRDNMPPSSPKPDAAGMGFIRTNYRYPKPTTGAVRVLGINAVQNIVDLDDDQRARYFSREDFEITSEQTGRCTGIGYIIVRHQGVVLGVARYRPKPEGGGAVESLFPKGWTVERAEEAA